MSTASQIELIRATLLRARLPSGDKGRALAALDILALEKDDGKAEEDPPVHHAGTCEEPDE